MSGSGELLNPTSGNSSSKGPAVVRNYKLANKLTLCDMQTKLQRGPAENLSSFLQEQAASYDELAAILATAQGIKDGEESDFIEHQNELCRPLLADSPDIIHHLDDRILSMSLRREMCGNLVSTTLTTDVVAGINEAIQEGEILWQMHSTFVIGLGQSEVVKISTSLELDEVENLAYLNSLSLGIPIPSCLGALKSGRNFYFFMSRAPGQSLEHLWPELNTIHKTSIQQQLTKIFSVLRSIPPPLEKEKMIIGSFGSGTCTDLRRSHRISTEPIRTEVDLNDFLCSQPGRTRTPWIKMIQSSMRADHKVVATHGDLHPRNIMVIWDGDEGGELRVTSIIDWEVAGWYPEYWEFVKSLNTIEMKGAFIDWCDYLPTDAIGSWPMEFSLDLLIGRWLG